MTVRAPTKAARPGFLSRLLHSPARSLILGITFIITVILTGTIGYRVAGWSWGDAIYMVILTVYTVGFDEVRPIDTPELRALTIAVIVTGCTGMIFVTSALIQFITVNQVRELLGSQRMKAQLDKLSGHVVICGYGRIGIILAQEMSAGQASFLILDRSDERLAEARERGYLCMAGDATDEAVLRAAGVERARAVATVLPNDAANVFITLSVRSLNSDCEIIARGEATSTERKLRQAGANHVVLPTHIGAERIAEIILFPGSAAALRGAERLRAFDRELNLRGLEQEILIAREDGVLVGLAVGAAVARIAGNALVVALNRRGGEMLADPSDEVRIEAGDGLVLLCRAGRAAAVRGTFGLD